MRSSNTFGIQFILRPNQKGTHTIYARIVVNSTQCELGLKQAIAKDDWNSAKGAAKPKTHELKKLNNYLEEVRTKLVSHYRELDLSGERFTAETVKNSYLGRNAAGEEKMSLNRLVLYIIIFLIFGAKYFHLRHFEGKLCSFYLE